MTGFENSLINARYGKYGGEGITDTYSYSPVTGNYRTGSKDPVTKYGESFDVYDSIVKVVERIFGGVKDLFTPPEVTRVVRESVW